MINIDPILKHDPKCLAGANPWIADVEGAKTFEIQLLKSRWMEQGVWDVFLSFEGNGKDIDENMLHQGLG